MVAEDRYSPYHTFTQNCLLNEIPTKSKYWITTGGILPKTYAPHGSVVIYGQGIYYIRNIWTDMRTHTARTWREYRRSTNLPMCKPTN